jgi:RNA-binding protein YlmH
VVFLLKVVEGDVIKRISETQPRKEEIKFGQVKVVSIGDLTKKGNYHVELFRNKSLSLPVQEFRNKKN